MQQTTNYLDRIENIEEFLKKYIKACGLTVLDEDPQDIIFNELNDLLDKMPGKNS